MRTPGPLNRHSHSLSAQVRNQKWGPQTQHLALLSFQAPAALRAMCTASQRAVRPLYAVCYWWLAPVKYEWKCYSRCHGEGRMVGVKCTVGLGHCDYVRSFPKAHDEH